MQPSIRCQLHRDKPTVRRLVSEVVGVKTGSSTMVTRRAHCCNLPNCTTVQGAPITAGTEGHTRPGPTERAQKSAARAASPVGVGGQLWGHLLGSVTGRVSGHLHVSTGSGDGDRLARCLGGSVSSANDSARYTGDSSKQPAPRPALPRQQGRDSERGAVH